MGLAQVDLLAAAFLHVVVLLRQVLVLVVLHSIAMEHYQQVLVYIQMDQIRHQV
jgi:hypothetical protein